MAQTVAPDTTKLAVGGRILGMGRAFVGLADDTGAIFTNPAGLASLNKWEITSMSGTFMEDYNYLNLSGAYPTRFGVFGFGFANSGISGGYATKVKAGSDPNDPVYEPDYSQPAINYGNNVFLLSYGQELKHDKLPFKTFIGSSLKFIYSEMAGDGIGNGKASGNELDLGILIKPAPHISIGSTIKNTLTAAMGGKITYPSGHSESYPALLQGGVAFNILGKENALKTNNDHELKALLDFDYALSQKNIPTIFHLGVEWSPIKMVDLRCGIDQDVMGDGAGTGLTATSNFTAGVGINYSEFRFDYAYHQFAGTPGVTNNFFSLSYSPPNIIPAKESAKPIIKPTSEETSGINILNEVTNLKLPLRKEYKPKGSKKK